MALLVDTVKVADIIGFYNLLHGIKQIAQNLHSKCEVLVTIIWFIIETVKGGCHEKSRNFLIYDWIFVIAYIASVGA
jgi:hypothetical protein